MIFEANSKAKTGSIEEEQPAMREIVPVGAMVRTVAFRHRRPLVDRLLDVGKTPFKRAELPAFFVGLLPQEAHQLLGEGQGPGRVVLQFLFQKQIGPAHDAEPDPAVGPGHLSDLGKGVLVDVDDVVQEADGDLDDPGEPFPVEGPGPLRVEEVGEVDRAEIAGLVGVQGLLAAGIRRPDGPEVPAWGSAG